MSYSRRLRLHTCSSREVYLSAMTVIREPSRTYRYELNVPKNIRGLGARENWASRCISVRPVTCHKEGQATMQPKLHAHATETANYHLNKLTEATLHHRSSSPK